MVPSPRERVLLSLQRKSVDSVPVTCVNQTATLDQMNSIQVFWPEAHVDPSKMAKLAEVAYMATGLETARVPYDQTVEAEALGCKIRMGRKDEIPSVVSTPFKEPEDIEVPKDLLGRGRIPAVIQAVKILRNDVGGQLPIMAGIVGPFTLGSLLIGVSNFLYWTLKFPEKVKVVVSSAMSIAIEYGKALLEAGADVIVIEDMSASTDMISPKMFDEYAKPPLKMVFNQLKGIKVLHICGNANLIIDKMIETKPEAISVGFQTDIGKAKEIAKGQVAIVGNLDPVKILLQATPQEIEEHSIKALEAEVDLLAPGCSLAPATPTINIKNMVETAKTFKRS